MAKRDDIKNVLNNYRKQAQHIDGKIAEARKIYQGDVAEKEIDRLKGNLAKEKASATKMIREITDRERHEAKLRAVLDGAKITDDAKLLDHDLVEPEQFTNMVEKYKDNGTMSQLLRNYGEKQNAERRAKNPLGAPAFNVSAIMRTEDILNEIDHAEKSAISIMDMIDGGPLGGANSEMVTAAIDNFI